MPPVILATDHTKDQLTLWIANALKCEMFPRQGDSIANVELPAFGHVRHRLALRSEGDDTHVIYLTDVDGKVFTVEIRYVGRGDRAAPTA